jgi:hypothetical protein
VEELHVRPKITHARSLDHGGSCVKPEPPAYGSPEVFARSDTRTFDGRIQTAQARIGYSPPASASTSARPSLRFRQKVCK